MTEQEKQWFEALTKDRTENANVLEKTSMKGIWRSVVDKYSDQAHFIYELLQNANDVKATAVKFRLEENGLYFIHNGSVRFTISNPQNEEADTQNGTLGHINAITSIANSNKTEASIGKFGVGFKAVFQYTQTPNIYDPNIRFKIERFIVPQLLDNDLEWRKPSETVFFFPFDHKQKQPNECYEEILKKLTVLEFPVLFLSSVKSVLFEAKELSGEYNKTITSEIKQDDITLERVELNLTVNKDKTTQHLLVFSRNTEKGHRCSIGYAVNKERTLVPIVRPAFCFFPTKEVTNLNFILQAPFLLTDSREGIKAGEKHNQELIQHLAQLAAECLPILRDEKLIDDGLLDIIPYDSTKFSSSDDSAKISFKPFFEQIKHKLQNETLLPASNGEYAAKSHSYWASDAELVELFSDRQLAQLTGTSKAKWIFPSRGKKEIFNTNKALAEYIDGGDARLWNLKKSNLIVSSLDPEAILKKIGSTFTSSQSTQWLHKLYNYLKERESYQKFVKTKPIFLDQHKNAVPAFDEKEQAVLFLPDKDIDDYTTIHPELLSITTSREFIVKFGVKKPSLRDEIYNKILPTYDSDGDIDTEPHFKKFFRYFKECRNEEVSEFIALIKDKAFLEYKSPETDNVFRGEADDIYLPTVNLQTWFKPKTDTKFLLFDHYKSMVGESDVKQLIEFLRQLGVSSFPRIKETSEDRTIDGLTDLLAHINSDYSEVIWKIITENWGRYDGVMRVLKNYYGPRGGYKGSSWEETSASLKLRSNAWILNNSGTLCSANEVTIQSLSDIYNKTSPATEAFVQFLGIRDETQSMKHLSAEEARKIKLVNEIEQYGLSENEIKAAIQKAKLNKEIVRRRLGGEESKTSDVQVGKSSHTPPQNDSNDDTDDYTPKVVDYSKKLDRAKDRYASELDRLEREQSLHDKAISLPEYSYGRLLALLELECMASGDNNAGSKTISIRFGKVERDSHSSRTIILKEPSRFIPQAIEELSGVRVDLDFGDGRTGKMTVESFTAKEFILYGKLTSEDEFSSIDLSEVLEARIDVQNPSFLLEVLLERFRELNFDERYDMQANLTPNIEFIFGPPGTGKTTHLADKVLIPMMKAEQPAKVLVLTPTNKAADVLTTRIIEKMGTNTSYQSWLVRFGTSSDERIEEAGVWRDRTFDISGLNHAVTVTTIARFTYDGFAGKKLNEMKWDAIVIDEASMISLISIIYPLYQQKPQKFIIAGDPFQIEPIVAIEEWKDENIYKMIGLNQKGSFAKPITQPHDYLVTNLETQYRSIPAIGEVFSRFTYDGILKHYRKSETQRPLKLNGIDVQPVNLIKFPVSKYESIYRAKRLESGTPYQSYSALFTFEFTRWLSEQINNSDTNKLRIGIIAPYRAQANILSRLHDSWTPKPNNVEIQVGTIHGFQGDECDIIIAVLNPPPSISTSPQLFLNKQNILNVAISRARDYLFVIMPDDETEDIKNLKKVAKVEQLIKAGGAFAEYASHAIEKIIWDKENYLEENTFSTGHQMVNVYRKPERYYEIRSDESAIDVQIHGKQ